MLKHETASAKQCLCSHEERNPNTLQRCDRFMDDKNKVIRAAKEELGKEEYHRQQIRKKSPSLSEEELEEKVTKTMYIEIY